ncbi:hypothetical protein [Salinisphaera sp. Q1T1-3]|uniref:hypothetical protein n=1 Tax=Salinisphaera sp. Q1T1-3 TaxID=2321229 RepID=UPI000E749329|nr:hypothetical protein [Salinisphaera sp. Q1T1-3]RJS92648.1 hypothetical protein D3260_10450 [Salinisphaera sp. Q1T1-3]
MAKRIERIREKIECAFFARGEESQELSADRIHVISCIGVELESDLVGHFADHYLGLGVPAKNFHIVLNATRENADELRIASSMLETRGIVPEEIWVEPYTSEAMWQKRRDVQRRCVPKDHWVISADADEFHEYPLPLPRFLAQCELNGVTCVDGVFVDRVTPDGTLPSLDRDRPLSIQFPVQAMVQGRIVGFGEKNRPFGSIKLMAFDAGLLPAQGGHGLVDKGEARFLFGRHLAEYPQISLPAFRFCLPLRVHHYKWHAGLMSSLNRRLSAEGVSPAGKEYGENLMAHIRGRGERIDFAQIAVYRKHALSSFVGWRTRLRAVRGLHYARKNSRRIRRKLPI